MNTLVEDIQAATGIELWTPEDIQKAQETFLKIEEVFKKKRDAILYPLHMNLWRKQGYKVETISDKFPDKSFPTKVELLTNQLIGDLSLFYNSRKEFMVNQIDEYEVALKTVSEIIDMVDSSLRKDLREKGTAVTALPAVVRSHPLMGLLREMQNVWRLEKEALERRISQMEDNVSVLSRELTRRMAEKEGRV